MISAGGPGTPKRPDPLPDSNHGALFAIEIDHTRAPPMIVTIANVKSTVRRPSSRSRGSENRRWRPTTAPASVQVPILAHDEERPQRANEVGSPSAVVRGGSLVVSPDDHSDGERCGCRRDAQRSADWSADPGPTAAAKELQDGGRRHCRSNKDSRQTDTGRHLHGVVRVGREWPISVWSRALTQCSVILANAEPAKHTSGATVNDMIASRRCASKAGSDRAANPDPPV